MTTKLAGKATFFLPFNKGHNSGAGNPPNKGGHKSAYLWVKLNHDIRLDAEETELELYKLLASDAAFKSAMQQSLRQIVDR